MLETRDQHLPDVRPRSAAPSGFVHHTVVRVSCPDCLANGRRMPGCSTCGGQGWLEERRDRDPYSERGQLKNRPVGGEQAGFNVDRHERTRERDRMLDRLGDQLRPASEVDEDEDANAHPYRWERERARMWRRFDYAWLDVVLDSLRARDPDAAHALHAVYVYGWLREASAGVEAAVERGLRFLELRGLLHELVTGRRLRAPGFEHPAVRRAAGRRDTAA